MKYFIKLFLASILLFTLPLPSFAKKVILTLQSCISTPGRVTVGLAGSCFWNKPTYLKAKNVRGKKSRSWHVIKGCKYSMGMLGLDRIYYVKMSMDKTLYIKHFGDNYTLVRKKCG